MTDDPRQGLHYRATNRSHAHPAQRRLELLATVGDPRMPTGGDALDGADALGDLVQDADILPGGF